MSGFYDLSKRVNYLNRQMFLDDAGPVTIHRFEEIKDAKIDGFEEMARGFFWNPKEIDLSKDANDAKEASFEMLHIFKSNLLRQTALDSLQGKLPSVVLIPIASTPELEGLFLTWGFFEGKIHNLSYAHIIRNTFTNPGKEFDSIHDIEEIVSMASNIGKYYDDLYKLNCLKEVEDITGICVDKYEHKKAIWLAMNASFALEAIRFLVSFATSLGMAENKLFVGNGNIISLILKDENVHKDFTAYILNKMVKDDPDFVKLKLECEAEVYRMYEDVVQEEKNWAKYLCKYGPVIGLNEDLMCDYVDWTTNVSLKQIGIKWKGNIPKSNPFPWMQKYNDVDKRQVALQEQENVSYLIGAVQGELVIDDLPEIN